MILRYSSPSVIFEVYTCKILFCEDLRFLIPSFDWSIYLLVIYTELFFFLSGQQVKGHSVTDSISVLLHHKWFPISNSCIVQPTVLIFGKKVCHHGQQMTAISFEVKVQVHSILSQTKCFPINNSCIVKRTVLIFSRKFFHGDQMTPISFEVNRSKVIQFCYRPNGFRSITHVAFIIRSSYLVRRFVMVSR